MKNLTTYLASGALAVALSAGAASAAMLSINLAGSSPQLLGANFNPAPPVAGIAVGDMVTNFSGLVFTGGLSVDAPAKITVTFLGKEAGFSNTAMELIGGGILADTLVGASISFTQLVAGIVQFEFATNGLGGQTITNGVGSTNAFLDMAFMQVGTSGSYFGLFGDGGGNNDNDFDDMVVRFDVAAIPLPAAGFLLIGALGGLAFWRRRKTV